MADRFIFPDIRETQAEENFLAEEKNDSTQDLQNQMTAFFAAYLGVEPKGEKSESK